MTYIIQGKKPGIFGWTNHFESDSKEEVDKAFEEAHNGGVKGGYNPSSVEYDMFTVKYKNGTFAWFRIIEATAALLTPSQKED